ncbi:hypothetical protein GCM10009630_08230 [Kribbella jejuensis]
MVPGCADQVSTKPDSTKKNVTPEVPYFRKSKIGSGARFVMWWQNTKKAAHQRRPVSDSTRGNLLLGELGGAPDSPGKALTGAPGGGVDASAAGTAGGCVWFSSAAFVIGVIYSARVATTRSAA